MTQETLDIFYIDLGKDSNIQSAKLYNTCDQVLSNIK